MRPSFIRLADSVSKTPLMNLNLASSMLLPPIPCVRPWLNAIHANLPLACTDESYGHTVTSRWTCAHWGITMLKQVGQQYLLFSDVLIAPLNRIPTAQGSDQPSARYGLSNAVESLFRSNALFTKCRVFWEEAGCNCI